MILDVLRNALERLRDFFCELYEKIGYSYASMSPNSKPRNSLGQYMRIKISK